MSKAVQIAGVTGAAWLAGNIAALSLICVPALAAEQPREDVQVTNLAKQWRMMYENGKSQNPPIALGTASAFTYLAWCNRRMPGHRAAIFYGLAAACTLGIVPFTIIAMASTNNKLIARSEAPSPKTEASIPKGEEVTSLISKWGRLNFTRSLLPLAGVAMCTVAMLS